MVYALFEDHSVRTAAWYRFNSSKQREVYMGLWTTCRPLLVQKMSYRLFGAKQFSWANAASLSTETFGNQFSETWK